MIGLDPFSYTESHRRWVTDEWGSELALAALFRAFGAWAYALYAIGLGGLGLVATRAYVARRARGGRVAAHFGGAGVGPGRRAGGRPWPRLLAREPAARRALPTDPRASVTRLLGGGACRCCACSGSTRTDRSWSGSGGLDRRADLVVRPRGLGGAPLAASGGRRIPARSPSRSWPAWSHRASRRTGPGCSSTTSACRPTARSASTSASGTHPTSTRWRSPLVFLRPAGRTRCLRPQPARPGPRGHAGRGALRGGVGDPSGW